MRKYMVEHRAGEWLGPIDWSYDFYKYSSVNEKSIQRRIDMLKTLEENPDRYEATTDGGVPKIGWGKVVKIGMFDGWPYWEPTPFIGIRHKGSLPHIEKASVFAICAIREIKEV